MEKLFAGLRTVIYRVPDVKAAKTWYSRAFATEPYFDEPFYVGFNIGGYELGLQPLPPGASHPGAGGVEAYWAVGDIRNAYAAMLSLGATAHDEPRNVGGPIEVAMVKDPWGNIIGLIHNPLFKAE
ncbi:VOC family protein [Chitinophaga lutea]